jgi:DTW domain-containing protein YfiP
MATRCAPIRALDAATTPRPTCARCRRALSACACRSVERALGRAGRVANATNIYILQDRAEFRRALGSAIVCELSLEKCEVRVLFDDLRVRGRDVRAPFAEDDEGERARWGVLWPCDEAVDLEAHARDATTRRLENLIVLDSTWHRARAMYHRVPGLQRLRKFQIEPRRKSNYRFRKQPNDLCLSTAECVSEALLALEGDDCGAERVARAFDAMVDDQLDAERAAYRRGARERGAPTRPPSAVLARERDLRAPPPS